MGKYLVYITVGGVIEDTRFKKEDELIIEAKTPDEAVEKWLNLTSCDEEEYIYRGSNGEGWSYYYPITCKLIPQISE